MIETAAVIIPLILLTFVGIVCGSLLCCCCCCALPLWNLLTGCFRVSPSQQGKYQQMVNLSGQNSYYQTHVGDGSGTFVDGVPEQETIPIVEAYVVPPLEAAHHNKPSSHPTGQNIEVESSSNSARFKDVWAAVLFLANVVIIFTLAVQSYQEFQLHIQQESHSDQRTEAEAQELSQNLTLFSTFLVVMVPSAAILGSLSLYVLVQNAARLIDWVNWFNIISCGFMTILCLITFNLLGALIFALCTMVNYWYYWSIQDRIPFASAVISAASTAVRKHFTSLMIASFSGLFMQLLWILLWGVALFGVAFQPSQDSSSKREDEENGGQTLIYFLMLVSLYWGAQVIQYVVSVTAGGTVASWWFQPSHPAPVRGALFRALTTSFGSICFGSLIVAFLQALRELLRGIRKQSERRRGRDRNFAVECFVCIADCLLKCIEDLVLYFNRFAYSYVAAYGYDFISSGRQVTALFNKRGWNAIINDNLIANAFSIQIVAVAILNALLGSVVMLLLSSSLHISVSSGALIAGAVLGAILGAVVGSLMVSCLDSAVCMVFVCFAEDPATLQTNHPEAYHELARSWELFNPGTLTWTTASSVESGISNPLVQARVVEPHVPPSYHYGVPIANSGYHQPNHPHTHDPSAPHAAHTTSNPPPFNPNYRDFK